ncbi:hypothetical protein LNQ52_26110 [Klebsiella pneumoniae subsp. pneumoniae]|nr:hypothetical protein [Klebsiella pneumoniae subsp. pneumoniae]
MKKTIISLTALAMFVSAATHAEADTSKNRLPADWRRDYERLARHTAQGAGSRTGI